MPPPLENGKRTFSTKTRRERKGLGTSPFDALRLTTVPIPCVSCFRGIAVGPIGHIGPLGRRLTPLYTTPHRRPAGAFCGRGRFVPSGLHAPWPWKVCPFGPARSVLRSLGRQRRPLVLRALRDSRATFGLIAAKGGSPGFNLCGSSKLPSL